MQIRVSCRNTIALDCKQIAPESNTMCFSCAFPSFGSAELKFWIRTLWFSVYNLCLLMQNDCLWMQRWHFRLTNIVPAFRAITLVCKNGYGVHEHWCVRGAEKWNWLQTLAWGANSGFNTKPKSRNILSGFGIHNHCFGSRSDGVSTQTHVFGMQSHERYQGAIRSGLFLVMGGLFSLGWSSYRPAQST